ncbi:MAG: Hpt domain-containing protein [Oligoflexales bacterium]
MSNICNYNEILEHFDNSKDLFKMIFSKYKDNSLELMEKIKTSISEQDIEQLKMLAHTLKGSTSNFFAPELISELQNLEIHSDTLSIEQQENSFQKISSMLSELIKFCEDKIEEDS